MVFRQTPNSTAIGGEKIAKENQYLPRVESHSIYGSDEINKDLIPYRKDGALYPALSNGVYFLTI